MSNVHPDTIYNSTEGSFKLPQTQAYTCLKKSTVLKKPVWKYKTRR